MTFTKRPLRQDTNRLPRGNDSRSNYLWTDPLRHDIRLARAVA